MEQGNQILAEVQAAPASRFGRPWRVGTGRGRGAGQDLGYSNPALRAEVQNMGGPLPVAAP